MTLYDELGVPPDASEDALRAGYRRRARQLHPDVAGEDGATGDAMRRLNGAWAVLGDPEQRRRYDSSLAAAAVPLAQPRRPAPAPDRADQADRLDEGATPQAAPWMAFVRPSGVILVVLAVIFVVTAYAGPAPGSHGGSAGSPPSTVAGGSTAQVVGQCLSLPTATGPAAIVPCTSGGGRLGDDSQILAEEPAADQCPSGTFGHPSPVKPDFLCTTDPALPGP